MDFFKRLFGKNEKSEKLNQQGTWHDGMLSFLGAVAIALTIRWALFEAYVIPSGSMLPTLLIHDHIFVNKLLYGIRVPFLKTWLARFHRPERGEIIVFRYPVDEGTFFIKRIIGQPGDKIFYDNATLYVNDQKSDKQPPSHPEYFDLVRDADFQTPGRETERKDDYVHMDEIMGDLHHSILLRRGEMHKDAGPLTVPDGMLFVMGDNRDNSNDSRYWGFVPEENILGRAMFVWLSCEETLPVVSFLCNPLTIRWSRFFHVIK